MTKTEHGSTSETAWALRRVAAGLGLPMFQPGWVWLAGAGPGDPGLVTVLGLHAIGQADVILYDALANAELLKFTRPGARTIFAGKRGGKPSPQQAAISRALILQARKGKRVLRLKGGDPFVFGRGGEEALALVRAGVPFRMVPGVTAAVGGLAYAGIPLTHRETNHAVTFVTGRGNDGALPDLDWQAIAAGSPMIVIYMGLARAGEIAAKLIAGGRSADEAAAIVSNASLAGQATRIATLGELGAAAAESDAPALLVIGENVRLAAALDWLGAMAGRVLDPDPLERLQKRNAG